MSRVTWALVLRTFFELISIPIDPKNFNNLARQIVLFLELLPRSFQNIWSIKFLIDKVLLERQYQVN